jgi:uncharacterized protein with PQ loop repeat
MRNSLGWLGGILLALCAIPQAWECHTTQSAAGLSWAFLIMWSGGEVCLLVATWGMKRWLTLNYGINAILVGVILYYKLFF